MKYFVKRPNETEEFSFAATLEEIQTGYKNGEIQPEWAVRKEIEGSYDWITIQQLCGPEASSISLASPKSLRSLSGDWLRRLLVQLSLVCYAQLLGFSLAS